MESVDCGICKSKDSRIAFRIEVTDRNLRYYRYARNIRDTARMTGTFHIVRCENCSVLYTSPRFTEKELATVYSDNRILGGNWRHFPYLFDATQPDECQALNQLENDTLPGYEWKFDILKNHMPETEEISLLDVGCGNGAFVYRAVEAGYDAHGVDLSEDRIEYGKNRLELGERVNCGPAEETSLRQTFDVITMWDVIEHVPDPVDLLRKVRGLATENTRLFVLTMSTNSITYKIFGQRWNYINPTQHLFYFSHETMARALREAGWHLISVEMDDSRAKNSVHLMARILLGSLNVLFFKIYAPHRNVFKLLKPFLRPFQGDLTDERMCKRLENLFPGYYVGRYHDNFVFVAQPAN